MTDKFGRKSKIGDLAEVSTKVGLAYIQMIMIHPMMGELIRVIDGVFPERPSDMDSIVLARRRYVVFVPFTAAVKQKLFSYLGNFLVPRGEGEVPLFRAGNRNRDGRIDNWWVWNAETGKSVLVGALTSELIKLPKRVVWTDVTLVKAIEQGYLPESDVGQGPRIGPMH